MLSKRAQTDPLLYCPLTFKETGGCSWDTDVVCINLDTNYTGMLSLSKLNKLYIYCVLLFCLLYLN